MRLRRHPNTVKFVCPDCGARCTADIYPPINRRRDYPGEPMELAALTGCRHVLLAWEDGGKAFDKLYDRIYEQASEDAEAARERYHEQKGDLKRDEG